MKYLKTFEENLNEFFKKKIDVSPRRIVRKTSRSVDYGEAPIYKSSKVIKMKKVIEVINSLVSDKELAAKLIDEIKGKSYRYNKSDYVPSTGLG